MKGLARFPARFPWGAAFCVVLLGLWQGSGLLPAAGHNHVFPTPWAIIRQWVMDWPLYRVHAGATLYRALAGFALGAGVAFPIAVLFCISPLAERLMREINIAILTMPAIVAAPLLALVFSGNTPQILLAALLSYYPCMTATLLGLRAVDPRWLDLVSAYGGGPATAFRLVRLRACLPGFLSGLNGALPVALMGAVLGELGSGADPGLGSFLLNALGQANTARLWGIGLTVAALSLGGYMVLAWVQRHISNVQPVTMMTAQDTAPPVRHVPSWLVATGAVILPFALWGAGVRLAHLSPIIAPGPLHVLHSLTAGPQGAEMRNALLAALGQTLPTAAFGLGCGTLFAFMLAAVESLLPGLSRVILPLTLVVQNMPVIAIIPLIVSIAGRTTTAAVVVAVLVTFFPAYVILSHGFRHAPQAAIELVQAYGGGTGRAFRIVRLPVARGCVFTAMKLAMPQALLGVMVAEWLMTGTGLGNLLNEARSELDEDTVWAGSLVSIMISAAIYHLLSLTERHFAPGRQHSER